MLPSSARLRGKDIIRLTKRTPCMRMHWFGFYVAPRPRGTGHRISIAISTKIHKHSTVRHYLKRITAVAIHAHQFEKIAIDASRYNIFIIISTKAFPEIHALLASGDKKRIAMTRSTELVQSFTTLTSRLCRSTPTKPSSITSRRS